MGIRKSFIVFLSAVFIVLGAVSISSAFDTTNPPNYPPYVSLYAEPTSGNAPLFVVFSATAYDSFGVIVQYDWDFDGDGTYDESGTSDSTFYTYNDPGDYNAVVRVVDNDGETATDTELISVSAQSFGPELNIIRTYVTDSNGVEKTQFKPNEQIIFNVLYNLAEGNAGDVYNVVKGGTAIPLADSSASITLESKSEVQPEGVYTTSWLKVIPKKGPKNVVWEVTINVNTYDDITGELLDSDVGTANFSVVSKSKRGRK